MPAGADGYSNIQRRCQGMPISQDKTLGKGILQDYDAKMGLFALMHFDVIIDWKNGSLYLRPNRHIPQRSRYNRIGAVFVPVDGDANNLVGHVANLGPAYEAGIRDGDILLKNWTELT